MSQAFAVFILMSNYFHDVATAMPVACSFALWAILGRYDPEKHESTGFFLRLYKGIRYAFLFSWAWFISAGIIRFMTFESFEWINATEKHHEAALIVKYAIASSMMLCGTAMWLILRRRAGELLGRN